MSSQNDNSNNQPEQQQQQQQANSHFVNPIGNPIAQHPPAGQAPQFMPPKDANAGIQAPSESYQQQLQQQQQQQHMGVPMYQQQQPMRYPNATAPPQQQQQQQVPTPNLFSQNAFQQLFSNAPPQPQQQQQQQQQANSHFVNPIGNPIAQHPPANQAPQFMPPKDPNAGIQDPVQQYQQQFHPQSTPMYQQQQPMRYPNASAAQQQQVPTPNLQQQNAFQQLLSNQQQQQQQQNQPGSFNYNAFQQAQAGSLANTLPVQQGLINNAQPPFSGSVPFQNFGPNVLLRRQGLGEQAPSAYADDEAIDVDNAQQQSAKETPNARVDFDAERDLAFTVTSMTKAIKLSSSAQQTLPVQVSIRAREKTKENLQEINQSRPAIDLVCVIDCSGSMQGQKIELVRQTLKLLVDMLTPNDRLCIVRFDSHAQRVTPLLRVRDASAQQLLDAIHRLGASGGTDITQGMTVAAQVLKDRRQRNSVTSVFLLSDGLDGGALQGVTNLMNGDVVLGIKDINFTVHTFGFGSDHDPALMDNIAKLRDGAFYYVQHLETVEDQFVDALGGLFSVVAQDVHVKVTAAPQHALFKDVNVAKTYGDQWRTDTSKAPPVYSFTISQLICGVPKDLMLELQIPPVNGRVDDFARNTVLLEATLSAKPVARNAQKEGAGAIQKRAGLEITIYNEDEQIAPEINAEVEVNILRVRGAEALAQAMQDANNGQYQQGQQRITQVVAQIANSSANNDQRLKVLQQDLAQCARTCSDRDQYRQVGQFQIQQQQRGYMEQRSMPQYAMGSDNMPAMNIYANIVQTNMAQQTYMSRQQRQAPQSNNHPKKY